MSPSLYRRVRSTAGRVLRRGHTWIAEHRAPRPEATIELLFDGASRLNWRVLDGDVDELRFTSMRSGQEIARLAPHEGLGPRHGFLDTAVLENSKASTVTVHALRSGSEIPFALPPAHPTVRTKNIARLSSSVTWELGKSRHPVKLRREVIENPVGVVALKSTLGFVSLTVRSTTPLTLELRRRESNQCVSLTALPSENLNDLHTFRLSARIWVDVVALAQGDTVWDFWAVTASEEKRLGWTATDIFEPRKSHRFRATTSRLLLPHVVRMRPYWTTGQKLSMELTILDTREGNKS